LALLAKPIAAALPLAAAAIAIGWLNRPWRSTVLALLPWCALTVGIAALTMGEQGATTITHIPPLWQRPLMAGDALAFYLLKLVVPWPLGGDYGRSAWQVMHSDWSYVTWLVPLGLVAALWWLPRRAVWLSAAVVFIAGLLPVLGLVPFAYQNASTVADRYAYLAMLGPALATAAWLAKPPNWQRLAPLVVVLAIFAGLSFQQLAAWRNDRAWTAQTLVVNPASFFGLESQAQILATEGRAAEVTATREASQQLNPQAVEPCYNLAAAALARGDLPAAVNWYRAALKIQPDSRIAHGYLAECLVRLGDQRAALNEYHLATDGLARDRNVSAQCTRIGNLFSERGRPDLAREIMLTALRLHPTSIEALNNLAVLEAKAGKSSEGLRHLNVALSIDPAHTVTLANHGVLLNAAGQREKALAELQQAVSQAPHSLIARAALAELFVQADRTAEAAREYRAGLSAHPDWWEGHRALAYLLATDDDAGVRRGAEAVALAERLCAATNHRDPAALEALAAARAETGQFDGAVTAQSQAIALWRSVNQPNRLAAAERRLEMYRQSRPWREPRGGTPR
jgi:tetratricopeptide (TPR) repeat protein